MPLIAGIAIDVVQNLRSHVITENLCSYIDCTKMVAPPYHNLITLLILGLAILYLFEKYMLPTLFALFTISLLVFSYAESLGLKGEYGLFSLMFLAQFIAYLRNRLNKNTNLSTERIHFPLQIFAAAYVLSAIAKLYTSGFAWINEDAAKFAIQILREYLSDYSSSGLIMEKIQGIEVSSWLLQHLWVLNLGLGLSVLIEGFAFILITGKRNAFYYSFLLITLHIGIYLTMHLILYTIVVSMLAFTINPLYQFICVIHKIRGAFTGTTRYEDTITQE